MGWRLDDIMEGFDEESLKHLVKRSFKKEGLGRNFELDFLELGNVGEIAVSCQAGPVEAGFVLYLPRDVRNRWMNFYNLWIDCGATGGGWGKKTEKGIVRLARDLGMYEVMVTSILQDSVGFWENLGYDLDYLNMEGRKII